MKLRCPKCRRTLPQIGNDQVVPGDSVTCGMCGHVWKPSNTALGWTTSEPRHLKRCQPKK